MFLKIIGPEYTPAVIAELTQVEAVELLNNISATVIDGRQKEAIEYLLVNMPKILR